MGPLSDFPQERGPLRRSSHFDSEIGVTAGVNCVVALKQADVEFGIAAEIPGLGLSS